VRFFVDEQSNPALEVFLTLLLHERSFLLRGSGEYIAL
jgi:hypothetical protein